MKKLLLLLGLIPALASAADTAISGLGAVSTVPDTYITVWANSGVSNVKITFLNLTNQILAGYAGQAYALSVAATAAHDATNTFPWMTLNLITNTFSGGPTLHANVDGSATSANNSTNFWGMLSLTNLPPIALTNLNWAGTNVMITNNAACKIPVFTNLVGASNVVYYIILFTNGP